MLLTGEVDVIWVGVQVDLVVCFLLAYDFSVHVSVLQPLEYASAVQKNLRLFKGRGPVSTTQIAPNIDKGKIVQKIPGFTFSWCDILVPSLCQICFSPESQSTSSTVAAA